MDTTEETAPTGQLGTIVAWRVPQSVKLDELRAALVAHSLSPELAGDLHARHVLSRALREMREGRVICKLQQTSADTVSFQLTAQRSRADGVDYEREAVISLNLNTSAISCDVPEIAQQARELVAEHAQKRLTNDLTRLVQSLFDTHRADLVPIREQGGAYFVPDKHSALVAQVRGFLGAIGGRLAMFAVKLGHGETSASVAESLTEYLAALIAEFRESCDAIGSDTGKAVINRRHERVADLRARLESYRGLLGTFAASISTTIDGAERDLLAKIAPPPPAAESIATMREQLGVEAPAIPASSSSSTNGHEHARPDRFSASPANQRSLLL